MTEYSFKDVLEKALDEERTIVVHVNGGCRLHGTLNNITETQGMIEGTTNGHCPGQQDGHFHPFALSDVCALTLL